MRQLAGLGIFGVLMVVGLSPAQEAELYNYELYPLQVGNKWVYRSGAEKVAIEVLRKEAFTRKSKGADGKEVSSNHAGFILKITSGNKILQEHVAVMKDGVYRLSAAGKQIQPPLRFVNSEVKPGESWVAEGSSEGTPLKGTFIAGRSKVQVPMGEFLAEVVYAKDFQVGDDRMEVEYWFAKDVGMVKQRVRVSGQESVLELESFTKGKG